MLSGEVFHKQLAVTQDSGKQIVEVMGYSPGQSPDRFHLLGLKKLFFKAFAVGDIPENA